MKTLSFITTLIVLSSSLWAQDDCNCLDQLDWMIKTFTENDAGYQYGISLKGEAAYQSHHDAIYARAKVASTEECNSILTDWLKFFRKGHFGIEYMAPGNGGSNQSSQADVAAIRAQYADTEQYVMSSAEVEHYMNGLSKKPSVEGIWKNGSYLMAVVRDKSKTERRFVGFLLDADSIYWMPGQVKLELLQPNKDGSFQSNYYMRDHSKRELSTQLFSNNYLQTGDFFWERVAPQFLSSPMIQYYFRVIKSRDPFLEPVSEETLLLRIPDFNHTEKPKIDSVIFANQKLLRSTPNLIIDLRYNGGGSDISYKEIIPYLYTNPIYTMGMTFRSTPRNNQHMLDFSKDSTFAAETREMMARYYAILQSQTDEFVNVDGTTVDTTSYDSVYTYPRQVAILVNESCASTTEQFLLAAKQSKKVKLFGHRTFGALDISNMRPAEFPCGQMRLWYSVSRSLRIPDMAIDGIGLQPDVYMNSTIPDYEWIPFVERWFEE